MTPPQSLFNRPSAALLRMRRELAKQQQIRAMAGKPIVKPFVQRPSVVDAHVQDKPEWLINEDWALLQVLNMTELTRTKKKYKWLPKRLKQIYYVMVSKFNPV